MAEEKSVLNVESRNELGTLPARRIRKEGKVPAVIYGLNKETKQCCVNQKAWKKIYNQDEHIVQLKSSNSSPIYALIKEVQYDYLKDKTLHVDFLEIDMQEEITTELAIEPVGTPKGFIKGGVLDQYEHELEVACQANKLPESIEVDVSEMDLDDLLYVKDMDLPDGVKIESAESDLALFHVGLPKLEEEKEEEEETEEESEEEESGSESEE